jgi:hypothetical protein
VYLLGVFQQDDKGVVVTVDGTKVKKNFVDGGQLASRGNVTCYAHDRGQSGNNSGPIVSLPIPFADDEVAVVEFIPVSS